jgi:hypothetical protein
MGEQSRPVEDELERALVSMRTGFLSGSTQIAAGVSSLEEHLADAPDDERQAAHAAITQIVGTQARLAAKMEALPTAAWDRFKAMVSLVKTQQSLLDQLGDLMQKYVLPRQLENLSLTPLPESPAPAFTPHDPDYTPHDPDYTPPAPNYEPAPQSESFMRVQDALHALDGRRSRGARRSRGENEEAPRSPLARVRDGVAGYKGIAAMIIAAIVLSMVPRDGRLHDLGVKIVAMVNAAVETASSAGAGMTAAPEPASTPPPAATAQTPAERTPPQHEVASVAERPSPAAAAPDQKRVARPAPALPEAPVVASRPEQLQPDETAPAALPISATPAAPPAPAKSEAATPPAGATEQQFVPVVFTHKDYDTVVQALLDLKQRFPNVMIGRKGEVQPVDLGKKGVWHRLVVLPAATRPEASRLCDQLMAEGYDRCWVKSYQ